MQCGFATVPCNLLDATMQRYSQPNVFSLLNPSIQDVLHDSPRDVGPYSVFVRRLAPSSQLTMRYTLHTVASIFGAEELPLDKVAWYRFRKEHVEALVTHMRDSGYSAHSCSKYLSALRGVLTEACLMGYLSVSELLKIQEIRSYDHEPQPRGQFIERAAFEELLSSCESDWRFQGVRDSAIIALLYGCGFHRNEVAAVNMEDLNLEEWSICTYGVHGSCSVRWLSPESGQRIQSWILVRDRFLPRTGPLFTRIRKGRRITADMEANIDAISTGITPGSVTDSALTAHAIYYILAGRAASCGIKVSPKDLRASFINNMITRHGPKMAQRLANHESIQTTMLYDNTSFEDCRHVPKPGEEY